MPLSESEQKILSDLEESFSRQDPRFARGVRQASVFFNARHRVGWSVAGFIVGLALLVAFLTQSIALSLVGVLMMLLSSLAIARNAELKGRASMGR
jgi:type IV secretory pathway VirB3-like protein